MLRLARGVIGINPRFLTSETCLAVVLLCSEVWGQLIISLQFHMSCFNRRRFLRINLPFKLMQSQ